MYLNKMSLVAHSEHLLDLKKKVNETKVNLELKALINSLCPRQVANKSFNFSAFKIN